MTEYRMIIKFEGIRGYGYEVEDMGDGVIDLRYVEPGINECNSVVAMPRDVAIKIADAIKQLATEMEEPK